MDQSRGVMGSIEAFVRVAELKSFRRAAAALGLTASATSKSIARLERRLGVKLLERTTREVSLTVEGETLLDHGRRALGELANATARLSRARDAVEGAVRIEAWPFFGEALIAPALPALLRRHPGLSVELLLRDPPREPGTHGLDLAVMAVRPRRQELIVREAPPLAGRAVFCASPAYLATAGAPKTLEGLRVHAGLGFLVHDQVQPWRVQTPTGAVELVPRGPFRSNNKELLLDAAVRGMGIVRVAEQMVMPLLKTGALETVLDGTAEVQQQRVFIARPGGRWMPRRIRIVFEFLIDLFAAGNREQLLGGVVHG